MAYNKEKIFNDVMNAIKEHKLKCFDYIEAYVEPSKPTLYEFFPPESNEFNTIKRELELNKINAKTKMRNKWEDSDNPTLQIAAFKLIATDEEQKALSTNWTKNEHDIDIKTKDISEYTTDELIKRAEILRELNGKA